MFERKNPKSQVVQDLADDVKRKISEIHLKIRSGDLSDAELEEAKKELATIKKTLETKMIRMSAQSVRPTHS